MKTTQTLTIEKLIVAGQHTIAQIASLFGISSRRVSFIKSSMSKPSRAEVRELWQVDDVIGEQRKAITAKQRPWVIL